MGMPLQIRATNDLLYNYALSSAYKSNWVYDPDFSLSREPDVWEVVQKDVVIKSAMDDATRMIVKPWRCEPPHNSKDDKEKLKAEICNEGLDNIYRFDAARFRLAQARILARIYGYPIWEIRRLRLAGTEPMDWAIPVKIRDLDRRRVHLVADRNDQGEVTKVHTEVWHSSSQKWITPSDSWLRNVISYVYSDTEDRLGYGRTLLESIYFYHYMKTVTLQKIGQGIDKLANGFVIGKLDGLRNASTGKINQTLRDGMIDTLQNMRSEHVIIVDTGDDVSIKDTSGRGHDIAMNFVKYLDDAITRLLLHSLLPFGQASEVGSQARAKEEGDTSEAAFQFERQDLDQVLNQYLLRQFCSLNAHNFYALGLGEARDPKFKSEQVKKQDPTKWSKIFSSMFEHGHKVVEQEYYSKLGLTMPGPDDAVVTGIAKKVAMPSSEVDLGRETDEERE
jgi:hypothetical protein